MSANIGSQANETYKYEAADGECRNQAEKMIESRAKASSIRQLEVSEMKSELQNGPMSIAVAAGNDCWRWYEGGILSEENNCPTGLDHGVVVVGLVDTGDMPYWVIQNSWGTGWGANGFIHIAVEDGEGTSAMNTHVEVMDVEDGYPRKADPVENCDHDESQNSKGPHQCTFDSECQGMRTCSIHGWC